MKFLKIQHEFMICCTIVKSKIKGHSCNGQFQNLRLLQKSVMGLKNFILFCFPCAPWSFFPWFDVSMVSSTQEGNCLKEAMEVTQFCIRCCTHECGSNKKTRQIGFVSSKTKKIKGVPQQLKSEENGHQDYENNQNEQDASEMPEGSFD